MLTPLALKERLEQVFNEKQATVLSEVFIEAYGDLVKSSDFNELKEIVRDLAEAQQHTAQRLGELAEAQRQSEQRLSRLEEVITDLAEAQQRTEEELRRLAQAQQDTQRQLGGLSMNVGYTLENVAYKALPELLQEDFGLAIKDKLRRRYLTDNQGREIEVDIFGTAVWEEREVVIVGEAKSQLSKRAVDHFIRRKLNRLEGVFDEVFPVLVTHQTTASDVSAYAQQKGIALYHSHDF